MIYDLRVRRLLLACVVLLSGCATSAKRAADVRGRGFSGGASDEPALARGLRDADPAVRAESAYALFRLRQRAQIPEYSTATARLLRVTFSDPDPQARRAAVYAFSRYKAPTPAVADGLAVECDEDPDDFARFYACRALGLLGKDAPWDEAVRSLADGKWFVRAEAVKALGLMGRAEYLDDKVYEDESTHVRAAAAEALAETGDKKLAYKLDLIDDEGSVTTRASKTRAFVKLKPRAQAERRLARDLRDPRWWVRSHAYAALAELDPSSATLAAGLSDPDVRVAAAALEAQPSRAADFLDPALPLELVGTALDLVGKKPAKELLPKLEAVYRSTAAARYPELADAARDAYNVTVSTFALGLPALPAREKPAPTAFAPAKDVRDVLLDTEKGEIELELWPKIAPNHVASFLETVAKKGYDGATWHRVVAGFVVQGGDPRGSGWGDCGFTLKDELNADARFERGTLGMPKAGPDTGGCQLFVTHVPTPHLDGRYTAFGRVVRGMDVVDKLEPGDVIRTARTTSSRRP